MGASAAYRQVALVGGSAARHSRKSKWGGAACEPKQEGEESGGCGAARGASRWVCVWQEPVNKRLSTRARPTGPSVERYLVWYGSSSGGRLQRRCACGVRAVCVRCACKTATVRNPATGVPCLIRRSASFVKKGFLSRRPCAGCERGGRCGLCGAVRCCEASVKARYLHGVSARHRSWYESGSSSASKGGSGGQGGGRWAGPTFWNARRCVLHMHAWKKPPCQAARSPAAVGAGWTQWLGGQGQGCGAALGVRAKG